MLSKKAGGCAASRVVRSDGGGGGDDAMDLGLRVGSKSIMRRMAASVGDGGDGDYEDLDRDRPSRVNSRNAWPDPSMGGASMLAHTDSGKQQRSSVLPGIMTPIGGVSSSNRFSAALAARESLRGASSAPPGALPSLLPNAGSQAEGAAATGKGHRAPPAWRQLLAAKKREGGTPTPAPVTEQPLPSPAAAALGGGGDQLKSVCSDDDESGGRSSQNAAAGRGQAGGKGLTASLPTIVTPLSAAKVAFIGSGKFSLDV